MRDRLADEELDVHVVWTKVRAGDTRAAAAREAATFPEGAAVHYWDPGQEVGVAFRPLLPLGGSPLAWDVYLFFDGGVTWGEEGPPEVATWTHQLGGAEPRRFAAGRIEERLVEEWKALRGTPEERVAAALRILRAAESFDGPAVGEGGDKSETYRAYERLRDHAPAERLVELAADPAPVVRCYAVQALAERHAGEVDLVALLRRHLDDVERVRTFQGCLIWDEQVGDLMLDLAEEALTEEQRLALAASVLGSKLDARAEMLRTKTFPESWRPRLRALAEGGDADALVALARYRHPDDVPLVVDALRSGRGVARLTSALRAAELHPDPRLLPPLAALAEPARRSLGKGKPARVRSYYAALAAQRSPEAAQVLATFLAPAHVDPDRQELNREFLHEALAEHRCQAAAPLLWALWREHGRVDPDTVAFLAAADRAAVKAQAAQELRTRADQVAGDVIPVLLDLFDRDEQVELVKAALPAAGFNFDWYAERAGTLRDPALVEPLFAGLVGHTNPHLYLPAAEALLAYQDEALTARVRKAAAQHEHLRTGWGGERLAKLLR